MIEIGSVYKVDHCRKGCFVLRVTQTDSEWTTGEIVSGTADAILDYNVRGKGDKVTIRNSHSKFNKIAAQKSDAAVEV